MEIHSHSHTPRKKWTHYFWEFLMLFLAVTLGFFVENRREHFIEGKRGEAYAKSLYDDLKVDTQIIRRTLDEKIWAYSKLDSLQALLDSPNTNQHTELIYYFERFITQTDVFTSQDITYDQLKNSGNFRYLHNMALYKKIADYYNLYSRYHLLTETRFADFQDLTEMESKLFNAADLAGLYNWEAVTFYDLFNRPGKKLSPITTDKQAMSFFYIKVANAKYTTIASRRFLVWLQLKSSELVDDLKKEYDLK